VWPAQLAHQGNREHTGQGILTFYLLFRFPLRGQTGAGGFPPRRDTPRANKRRCHASCGGSPHKRAAAPLCIPRSATIVIALGVRHSRKISLAEIPALGLIMILFLGAVRWPVFTRPSLAAFHLTAEAMTGVRTCLSSGAIRWARINDETAFRGEVTEFRTALLTIGRFLGSHEN
jgi:hypothetical protein